MCIIKYSIPVLTTPVWYLFCWLRLANIIIDVKVKFEGASEIVRIYVCPCAAKTNSKFWFLRGWGTPKKKKKLPQTRCTTEGFATWGCYLTSFLFFSGRANHRVFATSTCLLTNFFCCNLFWFFLRETNWSFADKL